MDMPGPGQYNIVLPSKVTKDGSGTSVNGGEGSPSRIDNGDSFIAQRKEIAQMKGVRIGQAER